MTWLNDDMTLGSKVLVMAALMALNWVAFWTIWTILGVLFTLAIYA